MRIVQNNNCDTCRYYRIYVHCHGSCHEIIPYYLIRCEMIPYYLIRCEMIPYYLILLVGLLVGPNIMHEKKELQGIFTSHLWDFEGLKHTHTKMYESRFSNVRWS